MRKAIQKQTSIMVEAILGRGLDNHLLGLRVMAQRRGDDVMPEIFKDCSYEMSNKFILSTSQVWNTADIKNILRF